jgi:gas vesicle protein
MAHHNDLPYIVVERRSGAVLPFLWGALVGAAVTLLWAPRSGRETQQELQGAADRLVHSLRSRVDDAREAMTDAASDVRQRVHDRVEAVRDAVETRAEGVRHAVDSGRRAAQEARQELEQRVATAKRGVAEAAAEGGIRAEPEVDVDVVVMEVVEERPSRPDPL